MKVSYSYQSAKINNTCHAFAPSTKENRDFATPSLLRFHLHGIVVLVVHHADVVDITPVGDVAVIHRGLYGATRFVRVGAIGEMALTHQVTHLGETLRERLLFQIVEHKLLDARRIHTPKSR